MISSQPVVSCQIDKAPENLIPRRKSCVTGQVSGEESTPMNCAKCKTKLAEAEQLFFYEKNGEKHVHLAYRPESRSSSLLSTMVIEEPKRKKKKRMSKVVCKSCGKGVGSDLPFGPDNTSFVAFAKDSVTLLGEKSPNKKTSWRTMACYSRIEVRDDNSFFGRVAQETDADEEPCLSDFEPITFPSPLKLKDFSWDKLLVNKMKPRPYQVDAFVEALSRNLIVVIPTGAGKTLVAALLLARMAQLNPSPGHMGLFIVESVPLVYQQAKAIHLSTGLRVCPVCGQSKTPGILCDLRDGAYDVLVVTGTQWFIHDLSNSYWLC